MLNRSYKYTNGISLLEILLVLMLVATGMALGFNQYFQYTRTKNIALIQQSVNALLQAGSVYYYATCEANYVTPAQISPLALQAQGGLPNVNVVNNPLGNTPFTVWIVSGNGASDAGGPPYLVQVRAEFSAATPQTVAQIANLLGADAYAGGTQLSWTRLPSQALKHIALSAQSPGGWTPAISGSYHGGIPISSSMAGMSGDLAFFSKYEADRAKSNSLQPINPSPGYGFTCPD